MNAGSSVQPSASITSTPAGASSASPSAAICAVAHEHVEPRVDALAGIEHARAAHEHVRAAARRPGSAALARVRSRRRLSAGEQVVEHGHAHDEPGAHLLR